MLPLGITTDLLDIEDVTVRQLQPGDTLLMPSDGITETHGPDGSQWGTTGLLRCLARNPGLRGADLLHAVERENVAFAENAPPSDDRTIVLASFNSNSSRVHTR